MIMSAFSSASAISEVTQCQLAKPVRPAFAAFQVDPAQLFDRADVIGGAVVQCGRKAHQGQVGSHGFSAVPGADHGEVCCLIHA